MRSRSFKSLTLEQFRWVGNTIIKNLRERELNSEYFDTYIGQRILTLEVLITQISVMLLINTQSVQFCNFMRISRLNDISLNDCGRTSRHNPDEMAGYYSRGGGEGGLICAVT